MGNKMNLSEISKEAYFTALEKGFWDRVPANTSMLSQKLALVHSEVSEALEVLRSHPYDKFFVDDFGEELADIIIRVADLAGFLRLPLDEIVQAKMEKNKSRPMRHNKAF